MDKDQFILLLLKFDRSNLLADFFVILRPQFFQPHDLRIQDSSVSRRIVSRPLLYLSQLRITGVPPTNTRWNPCSCPHKAQIILRNRLKRFWILKIKFFFQREVFFWKSLFGSEKPGWNSSSGVKMEAQHNISFMAADKVCLNWYILLYGQKSLFFCLYAIQALPGPEMESRRKKERSALHFFFSFFSWLDLTSSRSSPYLTVKKWY